MGSADQSARLAPPAGVVSVVMPLRNGAAELAEQLAALAAQTHRGPTEVIVADNGSTDAGPALVRSWQPRLPGLRLVDASARAGTSYARNAGIRASHGDLLLFCDHDDIVSPGWIAAMVRALAQHDAVGGRLEREALNDEVALAARPLKARDELLDSFGYLPYTPFANAGIRRDLWLRLGGLDEDYRYGSDDVVFFWRAQLSGASLGFAADAVVHYRLRRKPAAIARQAYGYGSSHPRLFREFRAVGMPRSDLAAAGRDWADIIAGLPALFGPNTRRAAWAWRAAMRCGRLVGSLRTGVVYL